MNDKAEHKAEELTGKAKEAWGDATGDDSTKAEGKKDQSKASLKQAGDKVKDAFN
ncbi:MAG TPA: CsbD family protein [Actinotalea sp.]|nr:CsbD family protein [Actinotalea sp.]